MLRATSATAWAGCRPANGQPEFRIRCAPLAWRVWKNACRDSFRAVSNSALPSREPSCALDSPARLRLRGELRRLLVQLGIPTLLVTHDRSEVLALGDDLAVMADGKIVQTGPVQEVFSRPANLAVAGIVAVETVQPARILQAAEGLITLAIGGARLVAIEQELPAAASDVYACIRAEDVILLKGDEARSSARNRLPATVRSVNRQGPLVRIDLDCGFPLIALLTKQACEELALAENDRVIALVKAPHIHLIPRSA